MKNKMIMTVLAGLWLSVSSVTHAGITYELDCADARCGDGFDITGFFELDDGIAVESGKYFDEGNIKNFEMIFTNEAEGVSFTTRYNEVDFFNARFDFEESGVVDKFGFTAGHDGNDGVYHHLVDSGGGEAEWVHYILGDDKSGQIYGLTWKLQETSSGSADVPAPHYLTILAIGIMGLATRRFKK